MNANCEQTSFNIPLSIEAHEKANQRRQGISNAENVKKIYLNTLAVYAVNYYLSCMGIETDWSDVDDSNPWMLSLMDLADLEVTNIGKIECRPVLPNEEYLEIPTEVRSDRVAYVAVQLDQSLKSATILGFTTQPRAKVHLSQLQPVDNLLDYCAVVKEPVKETATKVNIRQWLDGVITTGWQTVDEIFTPREISLRFARNFCITRGKTFDLALRLNSTPVALIVKLGSQNQEKIANQEDINIVVQVHPYGSACLPPELKLAILDENSQEVDAVISRQSDNLVEIELTAKLDEQFGVEIILDDFKVTQDFVV